MNVRPPLGAQKYIPQGGNISWLITLPMLASSAAPAPSSAPLRLSLRAKTSTSSIPMSVSAAVPAPSSAPPKQSRKPNSSEFRTACPASCRCRPFLITLQTLYEYVGSLRRPVTFLRQKPGEYNYAANPLRIRWFPNSPGDVFASKTGGI